MGKIDSFREQFMYKLKKNNYTDLMKAHIEGGITYPEWKRDIYVSMMCRIRDQIEIDYNMTRFFIHLTQWNSLNNKAGENFIWDLKFLHGMTIDKSSPIGESEGVVVGEGLEGDFLVVSELISKMVPMIELICTQIRERHNTCNECGNKFF